jgi:putative transcriptional regulator
MMFRWRLRMAAAERNVWTATELRKMLKSRAGYDLSLPAVAALMTREPVQLKLTTLAALCTALDCTPNDLLDSHAGPMGSLRHDAARRPVPREPAGIRIADRVS